MKRSANLMIKADGRLQILTGHEKGILSLSWCEQDSDLLLSCGKDNRVLCWNPNTSEIVGEVSLVVVLYTAYQLMITLSYPPRTIGRSRSTGVLVTQTSLQQRSSMDRLASTRLR
jgi:WD40 repeat protein